MVEPIHSDLGTNIVPMQKNRLVGGFKHLDYFPFHIWDNPSHWLLYFSEGLKPPTSRTCTQSWKLRSENRLFWFHNVLKLSEEDVSNHWWWDWNLCLSMIKRLRNQVTPVFLPWPRVASYKLCIRACFGSHLCHGQNMGCCPILQDGHQSIFTTDFFRLTLSHDRKRIPNMGWPY